MAGFLPLGLDNNVAGSRFHLVLPWFNVCLRPSIASSIMVRPPLTHPSALGVLPHFPQQNARQTFGATVRVNPSLLNAPLLVANPHGAAAPPGIGVRNGEILAVEPLAVARLDADRNRTSHFDRVGHCLLSMVQHFRAPPIFSRANFSSPSANTLSSRGKELQPLKGELG